MDSYQDKFQRLLRELFQFDCADLDFGIYRIMNKKRDVIEKFIVKDLPKAVARELENGALADQAQAAKGLKEAADQITQSLGRDALDADGRLAEVYHTIPLGKKYQELKVRAAGGRGREALEAGIFNHLYSFFSRYYQDGDFISKRRYSKRQKYAIPYNGEEVYLYWANSDQYYVKTAEYFHDYTFASHGVTVHFKLQAADVEQNNVKGEKRFFLPRAKETEWDEGSNQLVIPFEYRPLTEQEEIAYGKKNQQDAISANALEDIPKRLKKADNALLALTAERHKNSDGQPVTVFEHHLRQYTKRNTSDFFIHKDLKGFLSRELDFYLKNEVLNLDEMETAGEDKADGWFQIVRVIKAVGGKIIDFLDQIEGFQKMLWEKRKFITETQYCITMGNIKESYYSEIAGCEPQWEEWKGLFHIDEETTDLFTVGKSKKDRRITFLKAHPTLVLDTKHLKQEFVDRLLAGFADLDELTDGLLIQGENFQALNLLVNRYRQQIKCIYIDPPYNTGNDEFLYKDNYQHSSWLSMLSDRLFLGKMCMNDDGAIFISIDDGEQAALRELLVKIFGQSNFVSNIIWQKKYSPQNDAKWFSDNHDFIICVTKDKNNWRPNLLSRTQEQDARYTNRDNDSRGPWKSADLSVKTYSAAYDYNIVTPSGRIVRPPKGRCWATSKSNFEDWIKDNRIWFGPNGDSTPSAKIFLSEVKKGVTPLTVWTYQEVGHNQEGKQELKETLTIEELVFGTPKPVRLLNRIFTIAAQKSSIVMDFFAGSGSTGHSVITLNRNDDGTRKFILVEIGDFFATVLLPRIKKISFTPDWKDGKPKRMATKEEAERSPRIVKYIRLESYEDALNNIEFDDGSSQQAMKFDDYLIKYMLKWEARASGTLLNVEKLAMPFSYKLNIHSDGQTGEKLADIPETFNYLLGLHVQTRRMYEDNGREYLVYRGKVDHRAVVVIWRETENWKKPDLERDKKFVADKKLTDGADEVFVNGDSFIPNAKALEPVFKARMFAEIQG